MKCRLYNYFADDKKLPGAASRSQYYLLYGKNGEKKTKGDSKYYLFILGTRQELPYYG